MKITPTEQQLEVMAHIINDYSGREMREIVIDIWDYVQNEIDEERSKLMLEGLNARKCGN